MKGKTIWMIALLLGFMVACSDDDDPPPTGNGNGRPDNEVWMGGTSFIPVQLTVAAGTTVRWLNNSPVDHTVTSATGLFDQYLVVNQSYSYTFVDPGTYQYTCTLHPGMSGTIVVE